MTARVSPASPLSRLLIPGLCTLVALAILISLGVWQLERKQWKEGLIESLDRQMKAPPVPLPPPSEWGSLTRQNSEFRKVSLRVDIPAGSQPALLYTGSSALRADVKQPGYFVFTPARLPDGETIVVNRGYVPVERRDAATAGPTGPVEITGFIRWPETATLFVADRDTKGDIFFLRDPKQMAEARGWGQVAPFYIDQEGPVPAGGLPRPGPLKVNLRNDHLGYAITWFGLAASLIAVFAAFAARNWYHKTA